MTTLTDFLLARIDEDETLIRADRECHEQFTIDPVQMLADLDAKRRIVARHRSSGDLRGVGQHRNGVWTSYCEYDSEDWPCPDVADLALPYADHPDYRDEWRP